MPLFDFECQSCEEVFEELVRADDRVVCPRCEGADVKRLLAPPALKTGATASLAKRAARQRDARQSRDRMHERLRYEKSHDRHG